MENHAVTKPVLGGFFGLPRFLLTLAALIVLVCVLLFGASAYKLGQSRGYRTSAEQIEKLHEEKYVLAKELISYTLIRVCKAGSAEEAENIAWHNADKLREAGSNVPPAEKQDLQVCIDKLIDAERAKRRGAEKP